MHLLPQPRQVKEGSGTYTLLYHGEIILDVSCTAEDYICAKTLQEELKNTLGLLWSVRRADAAKAETEGKILLQNKKAGEKDGYTLSVKDGKIELSGNDGAGLWYGVQTLRQLIRQKGAILPTLEITDWPEMEHRGFYHDVTRGRIPTLETLKHLVDKMVFYKLNQLQLYVEHTFLFRNFSEIWRDDTPLTAEDILELDRYCRDRHVELVPSLSSFGHLHKVLSSKTYAALCELPEPDKQRFSFPGRQIHHTVDVTNEDSIRLIRQMIEEFIPLFSSVHFNICADETFDLGTGKSKELGERIGKQRLYMDFLKQICQIVTEHGKVPMFWGDIVSKCPESIKELPENVICLNWGYAENQGEEETQKFHAVGATQYLCPGVHGWNNLVNDMKGSYENIKRMCSYAAKYHAAGVLNTDWGDYGHINHPEFSTVGMIYGASFSWNPQIPEREEINRAISVVEYGDKSEQLVELLSSLKECGVFTWSNMVLFREITEGNSEFIEWYSTEQTDVSRIPQAQKQLEELEHKLYEILAELPQNTRKKLYAYLLAAEGIRIFNRIGAVVCSRSQTPSAEGTPCDKKEEALLAETLEHWYHRYQELWRTVSRESELYRISQVVHWYGDYLRT